MITTLIFNRQVTTKESFHAVSSSIRNLPPKPSSEPTAPSQMFLGSAIPGALLLAAAALQSNAEEFPCTFCPFGYEIQNPDAFVNETAGLTCSDLSDEMASSTLDPETCSLYRFFVSFDYPDECGYCEVPPEDVSKVCTICSDGSSPNADASTEIVSGSITCGFLSYQSFDLEADTSNCTDIQAAGAFYCGCPSEGNTDPCELCPDGLKDPAFFSEDAGMTCSELVGFAQMVSSDSETCDAVKMLAALDCGCPFEANADPCELCPGGLEDPTLFSNDADMTCGELLGFMSSYSSDSEMCDSGKMLAAFDCGCPFEDNADPCELCPGGLDDPTLLSNEAEMTCSELVGFAQMFSSDSETCDEGKMLATLDCGCPVDANADPCELCPGGLDDPTLFSGDMMCGELVEIAPIISSDSERCDEEKAAAFADCGCPSEGNTYPCELCPSGLGDPTLLSNDADMTCGELLGFMLSYSSDSDTCEEGKMMVALDCGCPVDANTDPCELCPGGLDDPTLFSVDVDLTCGELVEVAPIVSSDSEMCDEAKAAAFSDCGCSHTSLHSSEDGPAPKKSAKSAPKKSAQKKEKSAKKPKAKKHNQKNK